MNGKVVTETRIINPGTVLVKGGRIEAILDKDSELPGAGWEVIDCTGKTVLPGFIDVHTHGGIGCDFTDEDPTVLAKLSQYYYSHGVTTLLATLSPLPHPVLNRAVKRIAKYCDDNKGVTNIYGIHMEGPYINKTMIGGNQERYIEAPAFNEWMKIRKVGNGYIKLMTIAPELPGIMAIVEDAVKNGVVIAVGHSAANVNIMAQCIGKGAKQITHLFNGMPQFHHREDGVLVEALLSDRVDAQIIADGVHVHPRVIEIAVKLKTPDHIIMITDSTRATQVGDGEYSSAGRTVVVKNGVVRLDDGTLAGSTLVMEKAFKIMTTEVGVDLQDTSKMTSLNAARSLGIDKETGSIAAGKKADIAILDENYSVNLTMFHGIIRYRA